MHFMARSERENEKKNEGRGERVARVLASMLKECACSDTRE